MGKKDLTSKLNSNERTYSFEQAVKASTEYFNGDDLAAKVWINKYALKDSQDNLYESNPDQMHHRLAKEIARIENKYENPMSENEIYSLLKDFKYIVPQGGPMSGIGNENQVASLSNCFVIGEDAPRDSYGGIMKTDQEQVQLMKRRGGVGHDLSHIRPKGSPVNNSAMTSTGIVPFMERFSNSTREVAQDGRRGALMLSALIKHPDIEEFIDAKMEEGKVTGANVSVKVDDDFMGAVQTDSNYQQQWPVDSDNPKFKKDVRAKNLWNKVIHNAWKSAEPGVLFWDTIINESIPDCYADLGYRTVSTNPCGEIPLSPYDSCRLLAVNLYSYVDNPFTKDAKFNEEKFSKHVGYAQRIMDDILDLELEKIDTIYQKIQNDPESEEIKHTELKLWENIRDRAVRGRRTGVGVTAEADMLAALGLKYGTPKATDFSEEIHKKFNLSAYKSSVNMAKERGAFEIYDADREKNNPMINRIKEADPELYEEMKKHGRRNIALLTIAPTGTTSLMTQTSSGIEPVFQPVYKRRRKVNPNDKDVHVDFVDEVGDSWEEFSVFHHKFKTWMQVNGHDINKKYSEEEIEDLVKQSPYYQASANDIDAIEKVRMQGKIQKWVDHSISVTHNLPEDVSEETVADLYMEGWKAGCKGITVYREGSRSGVLLTGKENGLEKEAKSIFPKERPEELDADIQRFKHTNGKTENWTSFIGLIKGKPYEIFTGIEDDDDGILLPRSINKGKIIKNKDEEGNSRYDFQYENRRGYKTTIEGLSHKFDPEFWNYAKLISGVLRQEMPIDKVVDLVSSLKLDNESINSWTAGVARALKKYIPDGTKSKDFCPTCLENGVEVKLEYKEGCLTCSGCGSSKCG